MNRFSSPSSRLWLFALLLLAAGLGGCSLFAAFYGIFVDPLVPPPTVPAEYDLAAKKVLILVDDAPAALGTPLLRRELTRQIQQQLLDNKAAASIVEYDRLAAFRLEHPDFAAIPIQQVGKQFQADVVLYLFVEKFTLHLDTAEGFYRLNLAGYVKLIDVATGERVWPATQTNRALAMTGELIQGAGQHFEDNQVRILAQGVALEVARYFYKHPQPKAR